MSGEDNEASVNEDADSGKSEKTSPGSSADRESVLVDQEDSLTRLGEPELEDSELQFRRTCEKINEIEERARHSVRSPSVQHRCSFCNRPSSEAGSLCQADHVEVCICLRCAEAALELLRT